MARAFIGGRMGAGTRASTSTTRRTASESTNGPMGEVTLKLNLLLPGYEGPWVDGKQHGKGKYFFTDGSFKVTDNIDVYQIDGSLGIR
jgi:hypothetical protein